MLIELICCLFLAVEVVVLYYPSIRGEFIFDDLTVLTHLKHLFDPANPPESPLKWLWSNFLEHIHRIFNRNTPWSTRLFVAKGYWQSRPLTWLTYRADIRRSGRNPYYWHSTSIALHILSTLMVFVSAKHWLPLYAAFITAVIFAAHPLGTMAVSYLSGRSSLVCGFLMLLAISLFLNHDPIAALTVWIMALFAKQEAVILLFILGAIWLLHLT